MRVGTAPISWGVCEIPGWGPQLPYERVLDEMRAAGYEGTELGPWGYLPTDPDALREALSIRGLALVSAFVPLPLRDPSALTACEAEVRRTAGLLSRLGAGSILLADTGDPQRRAAAGKPDQVRSCGLRPEEWPGYAERLEYLAALCREEYGLVSCLHPHGGTYVESPEEIEALLTHTDPGLVRLCLDTGHLAFGGGDPVHLTRTHADRIGHVHLKDIDLHRMRVLLEEELDYVGLAQRGVFVELGTGSLDLPAILEALRAAGYSGWIVVEQDRVVDPSQDTLQSARRNRHYLRSHLGL